MVAAYDAASTLTPDNTTTGAASIGGQTITPGVYRWTGAVTIPTDVTLSGGPEDVWIFQIGGDLSSTASTNVILNGGAQANNIFWVVAGGTTLGSSSVFNGIILDATAITLESGATLHGRALAQSSVNLYGNAVNIVPTVTGITPSTGSAAGGTSVTITGTGFTGATAVTFGSTPATDVAVVSDNSITATAPAGTAGTVDVTVTAPGGTSAISTADKYIYVNSIEITITGTESQWTLAPATTFVRSPSSLSVVVNSTGPWSVAASDADTTNTKGNMTDWTGSAYVSSIHLTNPLKVEATSGTGSGNYVTLPGGGPIVTGPAGTNQVSYPLGFQQVVTYADPILSSGTYRIVVTLTGTTP
jgi:hypothetical protein